MCKCEENPYLVHWLCMTSLSALSLPPSPKPSQYLDPLAALIGYQLRTQSTGLQDGSVYYTLNDACLLRPLDVLCVVPSENDYNFAKWLKLETLVHISIFSRIMIFNEYIEDAEMCNGLSHLNMSFSWAGGFIFC